MDREGGSKKFKKKGERERRVSVRVKRERGKEE